MKLVKIANIDREIIYIYIYIYIYLSVTSSFFVALTQKTSVVCIYGLN